LWKLQHHTCIRASIDTLTHTRNVIKFNSYFPSMLRFFLLSGRFKFARFCALHSALPCAIYDKHMQGVREMCRDQRVAVETQPTSFLSLSLSQLIELHWKFHKPDFHLHSKLPAHVCVTASVSICLSVNSNIHNSSRDRLLIQAKVQRVDI
jgi:hypothetical protein